MSLVLEPLVLVCPACWKQHVDKDEWAMKPHRTHLCEHCGNEWRPCEHATVGVPVGVLSGEWIAAVIDAHGPVAAADIIEHWSHREWLTPAKAKAEMLAFWDETRAGRTAPALQEDGPRVFMLAIDDAPPAKIPISLGRFREIGEASFDVQLPAVRGPATTWGGRST